MATSIKTCRRCGMEKPTTEFHRDRTRAKDGLHSYCKPCNITRATVYNRKKRYGVTPEMFTQMLADQGGLCAICGGDSPGRADWHIDHDHATGRVRGLLCEQCNHGLGQFRDDPERLLSAIHYLEAA